MAAGEILQMVHECLHTGQRHGVGDRCAHAAGRLVAPQLGQPGPAGEVTTLCDAVDGVKFGFTDDVSVARDGVVYFSDASAKFGFGDHMLDLLEGRPHGKLIAYDPKTRGCKLLGMPSRSKGMASDTARGSGGRREGSRRPPAEHTPRAGPAVYSSSSSCTWKGLASTIFCTRWLGTSS